MPAPDKPVAELTQDQRARLEEFIEEEEGSLNRYGGWLAMFLTAVAVGVSAFHLYSAYGIVRTDLLRELHVGMVLFLCFMLFPIHQRFRNRLQWWDVVLALLAVASIAYMVWQGDSFTDRNINPTTWDKVFGVLLIVLVIEAARRSTGWIMPVIIGFFLAYAFAGPWLPSPWTHRGYDLDRLVGHMYMTLEGIFGTAVDVSATLIILFTIYGAFLQYSGAGKFFLDFSFALLGGKHSSAGRSVVLASFLLGGPSGSGVATTVTIGSVAYPMLARAGYEKSAAGGLLAAGGLGAILSPPVLGAAAFLIAEFLKISYLEVIKMAVVPTLLYYFSLFLMVEIDARKYGMSQGGYEAVESAWTLAKRYWYHFLSLTSIVIFMLRGFSPTVSVFWATVTAFVVSFCRRGRHHRGRGHAHRPGPQVLLDRDRVRGRQPGSHRALYRVDRMDRGPCRAGDRLIHHLRGDRRPGAHHPRGPGFLGAHVHFLLRAAFGSLAAHGAFLLRRGGDHRG